MLNISPYLIIPVVAIVVAQIIKFAIHAFSHELDFKQLVRVGGVPSAHIAAVSALMFTAIAVDGIDSSIAGLTLVVGSIIIWDNLTTRSSIAKQVNKLSRLESKDKKAEPALQPVTIRSAKAIWLSALIGFVSGILLSVSYWKDDLDWFFARPTSNEIIFNFILFGLLFVAGEVLAYLTRRKDTRKLPTSRKLNRAFRLTLTAPALTGLAITFAQDQTLGMFDIRIWTYLVYDWILIGTIWAYVSIYRSAPRHLKEEREHFNKKKKTKAKSKKKKSSKKKRK